MSWWGSIGEAIGFRNRNSKPGQAREAARRTRKFNREEALKQRTWSAAEAAKTRQYNSNEAVLGRNFNAQQAAIQRNYQTEMSNTAVSRRAADMKTAGINPMLAAGNAAAQPVGGQASGSAASVGIPSGSAASSGMETVPNYDDTGLLKAALSGMTAVALARTKKPTQIVHNHYRR